MMVIAVATRDGRFRIGIGIAIGNRDPDPDPNTKNIEVGQFRYDP
jgi:hypothetical protein